MSDDEFDFLPLRVIRECSNGKRRYDPEGKRRLIEACLLPGASIAGLALKAQVNANQLHKWIRLHERAKSARAAEDTVDPVTTAFIPVVSVEHSYLHKRQCDYWITSTTRSGGTGSLRQMRRNWRPPRRCSTARQPYIDRCCRVQRYARSRALSVHQVPCCIARRSTGDPNERIWSVIEAAH